MNKLASVRQSFSLTFCLTCDITKYVFVQMPASVSVVFRTELSNDLLAFKAVGFIYCKPLRQYLYTFFVSHLYCIYGAIKFTLTASQAIQAEHEGQQSVARRWKGFAFCVHEGEHLSVSMIYSQEKVKSLSGNTHPHVNRGLSSHGQMGLMVMVLR